MRFKVRRTAAFSSMLVLAGALWGCGMNAPKPPPDYKPLMPPGGGYGSGAARSSRPGGPGGMGMPRSGPAGAPAGSAMPGR